METPHRLIPALLIFLAIPCALYTFWRYVWFFRNPERRPPAGSNLVSPADGTVVYVEKVPASQPVILLKKGRLVSVNDIVREDLRCTRLILGIFVSPFSVHYNRAPFAGHIELIRHHPARTKNRHMTSMHWRTMRKLFPIQANSPHVVENERTVTKFRGLFEQEPLSCYVVQIAGGSVDGIDSFFREGAFLEKGQVFGMIRIGSQVDLIITWKESMNISVKPGDKVRAGETVVIS